MKKPVRKWVEKKKRVWIEKKERAWVEKKGRLWVEKREWTDSKPKIVKPKVSFIAKQLDRLAEQHVIARRHVAQRPELLASIGLTPEDISEKTIQEAEAWHQHEMRRIIKRAGATYG